MSSRRNIFFIILIVGLFIEVLIFFPQQIEHQEIEQNHLVEEIQNSGPKQSMQGVHLVESQNGARDWELFAKQAQGHEQQATWNLTEIKVQFYNDEKLDFTLTSKTGILDYKTKDMKLRGDVVISSTNGYVFRAEKADYFSLQRTIKSESEVLMTAPADEDGDGMKVRGREMLVRIEQSEMEILNDVIAEKKFFDERKLLLTSQGAKFSAKNSTAHFQGQVMLTYAGMKIEGPFASFFKGDKQSFLSRIEFSGGVKTADLNKFATSERLNLDLKADEYTFLGKPKVYQNEDEITGDKIIFTNNGRKVRVEKENPNPNNKLETP